MWEFDPPEMTGQGYEVPFRYPPADIAGRLRFQLLGARLECVGVCFETDNSRPVSSPDFRAVPWGDGIAKAAKSMLEGAPTPTGRPDFYLMAPLTDLGAFARTVEQARSAELPRRGRPSLGDELYRETARVYREAWAHHEPDPTGAVARYFDIRPTTAARRVVTARRLGFLGKATPRKAGV
jgi:hypothetical protein